MTLGTGNGDQNAGRRNTGAWMRAQVLRRARVAKYIVVGCVGIVVNLGTLALLFTISSRRGWVPSAVANIASTAGNFVLHNLWTFSDLQHRGMRLIRGFLFFAVMSAVGICITTAAYVGLTWGAVHWSITKSHSGGLGVALISQFVAILLGATVSYVLNREFTWAETKQSVPAETTQVQEI